MLFRWCRACAAVPSVLLDRVVCALIQVCDCCGPQKSRRPCSSAQQQRQSTGARDNAGNSPTQASHELFTTQRASESSTSAASRRTAVRARTSHKESAARQTAARAPKNASHRRRGRRPQRLATAAHGNAGMRLSGRASSRTSAPMVFFFYAGNGAQGAPRLRRRERGPHAAYNAARRSTSCLCSRAALS